MKSFLFFALIVFSFNFTYSQSNNPIFEFDYAIFGYDSVSDYLEIYYSFNQNKLTLAEKDNAKYLEGLLFITITDSLSGKIVVDKHWNINHPITDSIDQNNKNLVGVLDFKIPFGKYKLDVGGGDNKKESLKYYNEYFTARRFYDSSLTISDIELASNILQDPQDKSSLFYKNSLEVIPAPTTVFGINKPVVFYYSELYNLDQSAKNHLLKVYHIVYNSKGNMVWRKVKQLPIGYPSDVEIGSIVINKFPTDSYKLIISVIDSAGNYGVSTAKKFYVFNPTVAQVKDTLSAVNLAALSSQFGAMSEEELDDLWEKSKYTSTPQELKLYPQKAGLEAKRQFIFNFWKNRDKVSTTPGEDTFRQYLLRVETSNQRFGSSSKIGWKTDRGRVFILYGEPSEIERFPNQMDTKPYEIWHYNDIEGGVIFVFADLSGFSDYMLINSTKRGELQDDNWQQRISQF
jgi:GWxTD domain-containing protein